MRIGPERRLPTEPPYSARVSHVAITLLGLVLAFVVANGLAGRVVEARDADWARRKWELALTTHKPAAWLFLGDSSGLNGVMPSVVSRELDGDCLNLCSLATLLKINDAWLLSTHLQQAGTPRNVVVVTAFRTWRMELDRSIAAALARVPLPLGFWNHLNPPLPLSHEDSQAVFLARYVPLYTNNLTLQYALADSALPRLAKRVLKRGEPMAASAPPLPPEVHADDLALGYAAGWPPTRPAQQAGAVASWERTLAHEAFRVSDTNRLALEFICNESERRGFDVWLANGPVHEDLYRQPSMQPYFAAIEAYQQALASRFHRVHYLPGFHTFPSSLIRDEAHVLPAGAQIFSRDLCDAIKQARR